MQLKDIKPGYRLEYCVNLGRKRVKTRKGIVKQVTPRHIALRGEKYPETILVNDLLSGQAKIIKVIGDDNMVEARQDRSEIVKKAKTLRATGLTLKATAERLEVPMSTLGEWLQEDKAQEQQVLEPEPAPAANQEAAMDQEPCCTESMPPAETECKNDLDEELKHQAENYCSADEDPIPYTPISTPESIMKANCNNAMVQVNSLLQNSIAVHLVKDLINRGLI